MSGEYSERDVQIARLESLLGLLRGQTGKGPILSDTFRRLEGLALMDPNICHHDIPPCVYLPDGTVEHQYAQHDCGKPRLQIILSYTDGSDATAQQAAEDFGDVMH